MRTCTVEGCDRRHVGRGYCDMHRWRWRQYGDPLAGRGFTGKGCITPSGYRKIGKRYEHRIVMEEFYGRPLLKAESVHHKNGNRADNRLENLELWSSAQPAGQRISDLVEFARRILMLYETRLMQELLDMNPGWMEVETAESLRRFFRP